MSDSHRIADRMRLLDASGIRKVFDLAASLADPINLSIGQPDFDVPEPIKEAARLVKQQGIEEVVQVHLNMPSFNVYSETISPARAVKPGDYVLTKSSRLDRLSYPYQELFRDNGIVLLRLTPANQTPE